MQVSHLCPACCKVLEDNDELKRWITINIIVKEHLQCMPTHIESIAFHFPRSECDLDQCLAQEERKLSRDEASD